VFTWVNPWLSRTASLRTTACGFHRTGLCSVLCHMRDRVRVDPVMARSAYHESLAPHFCHELRPRGLAWPRLAQLREPGYLVDCRRGAFLAQLAVPPPEPQEQFLTGEADQDRAGVSDDRPPVMPQSDPAES
jgi:hypothetical protein